MSQAHHLNTKSALEESGYPWGGKVGFKLEEETLSREDLAVVLFFSFLPYTTLLNPKHSCLGSRDGTSDCPIFLWVTIAGTHLMNLWDSLRWKSRTSVF